MQQNTKRKRDKDNPSMSNCLSGCKDRVDYKISSPMKNSCVDLSGRFIQRFICLVRRVSDTASVPRETLYLYIQCCWSGCLWVLMVSSGVGELVGDVSTIYLILETVHSKQKSMKKRFEHIDNFFINPR